MRDSEPSASRTATVDRLRADEQNAAAELLARCFADEPLFAYVLRHQDAGGRHRALLPTFRAMLRTFAPRGEIHTARLDGRLVGVGVRVPPGGFPPPGLDNVLFIMRMVPASIRIAIAARALEYFKIMSALAPLHPKEPHWYLAMVGVDTEFRRRGIGGQLADEVIRLADDQSMPCYLETFGERTAALYQSRGFAVMHEVHPIPSGPIGWALWRPPS